MRPYLEGKPAAASRARLLLKLDSHLPISGSIKAQEAFRSAPPRWDIALQSGLLKLEDNYAVLMDSWFRELFSQYSIAVGSTGTWASPSHHGAPNWALKVTVHMSADARQWKKRPARSKGGAGGGVRR